MSEPDVQYFASSGTWTKPAGAVRVDVLMQGGGGGSAFMPGSTGAAGETALLTCASFPAGELPDHVKLTVGKGGRSASPAGDGADGYILVVTHLRPPADGEPKGWGGLR